MGEAEPWEANAQKSAQRVWGWGGQCRLCWTLKSSHFVLDDTRAIGQLLAKKIHILAQVALLRIHGDREKWMKAGTHSILLHNKK